MTTETLLVTIDTQLRFMLFGLECSLDVEFSAEVAERIFKDGEQDAVSEKRYKLWASKHLTVTGYVEAYEPEDVWVTVESSKSYSPSLAAIVERAKYLTYRTLSNQPVLWQSKVTSHHR